MGFPAAEGDVDIFVVEQDPEFSLLRGRQARVRFHLNEIRNCGYTPIDRLVEPAIHPKWILETYGPDSGAAANGIARDNGGRNLGSRDLTA
jgi:hypothetical protein